MIHYGSDSGHRGNQGGRGRSNQQLGKGKL